MLHHSVEDRQQLAPAGRQGDLLRFPCGEPALIKGVEDRMVADCDPGSHIQGNAQRRPPQIVWWPRMVPRVRLHGATPVKAAMRVSSF